LTLLPQAADPALASASDSGMGWQAVGIIPANGPKQSAGG